MSREEKRIYQKIQEDILRQIEEGRYGPGDLLPSENQMAEIYSASVPTVRRALTDLVYQRVIYRVKGKGTFVREKSGEPEKGADPAAEGGEEERLPKHDARLCFLVLADTSDSSIMKMIRGAQSYLQSKGYTMSILCGDETRAGEWSLIQECLESGMEGVIWYSIAPDGNLEGLRLLTGQKIPVVMLDRGPSQIPFTLVASYNQDGSYQMTRYLLGLGHRRIVYAADQIAFRAEKDRLEGYAMALAEEGIPFEEGMVVYHCMDHTDAMLEAVRRGGATAVQCVNDKTACQVIRRLMQAGYRIPEDISVTGFDNAVESEYSYPRITTVHQHFEDMGRMAAKKLLKLLNGETAHSQTFLPVELVVKESSCPPRKGQEERNVL